PQLLRGLVSHEFDGAGMVGFQYDFRGDPTQVERRVLRDYRDEPDWQAVANFDGQAPLPAGVDSSLEAALTVQTVYDALHRATQVTTPDNSITTNSYNVAGLLETVSTRLGRRARGSVESFVKNIDYDARGRRSLIEYGNGVRTVYQYDKETFRL